MWKLFKECRAGLSGHLPRKGIGLSIYYLCKSIYHL